MYNVDLFLKTGFNSVDIPNGPALLYTMATQGKCEKISLSDINLVQDEWEANIALDANDITIEQARNIDYVIIIDSDHYSDTDWMKYTTCYTVRNYQDLGGTIKLNLLLDPYNTMGGFEEGSGNTVIAGSANRISVPLNYVPGKYPQAEDNTFFTLDEPFQPASRILNEFIGQTPGPVPVPTENGSMIVYNANGGAGTMESDKGVGIKTISYNLFMPPAGKKFNIWKDDEGVVYVPGGTIELQPGQVLNLYAQWVNSNYEDFAAILASSGKGKKFVITADDIDAPHWEYTWNGGENYNGFAVEFNVDHQDYPIIENLNIDDENMQWFIGEIEAYINSLSDILNENQLNTARGIMEDWTHNIAWTMKFFNDCNTIWEQLKGSPCHTGAAMGASYIIDSTNKVTMSRDITYVDYNDTPRFIPEYKPFVLQPTLKETFIANNINSAWVQTYGVGRIEYFQEGGEYATFMIQQEVMLNPGTLEMDIEDNLYFEKEGKRFVKWNTEPDGSGTDYTPGSTYTVTGPSNYLLKLYAQWEDENKKKEINNEFQ